MRKKLFSKSRLSRENIAKFFDKEGFYVVVFLCIAIIATTAVYVTRNNMDYFSDNPQEKDQLAEEIDDHEYFQPEDLDEDPDEGETASAMEEVQKEEEQEAPVAEEAEPEEQGIIREEMENAALVLSTSTQSQGASASKLLSSLISPVDGSTITMDYSYQTVPVFSQTLNEFRSDHQGIDIRAEKGTVVKAAADGKVVDIVEDPRLGMLITIEHGNGIVTKYGNLDKEVEVTKNQQVKKGQALGKVGNTAMFEIEDDPHIHFEVWRDDEPVDPKKYLDNLEVEK